MKKIAVIISILISQALTAQATPGTSPVINGTPSHSGKWPWMVSISEAGYEPRQGHFCGGVLINSTHVLTAAHCVADFVENPEAIQVTIGRTRLTDSQGITVHSSGLVIHPEYDPGRNINDIAIIRIEETGIQDSISPVSYAEQAAWDADSAATVIGWGFVDTYYPVRPDNLQQAEIPIVAESLCSERMGIDFDSNSMMCAGKLASSTSISDGVDACNGDSGGPLVVQTDQGPKLAGLVSWGYACGSDRYWGVYTKVALFHDWINSNPLVQPYARTVPTIRGRPEVNSTLVCQKGDWGGEGTLTYSYSWYDLEEGLLKESKKPSYRLKRNDIGRNLKCIVTARSSSSESTAETAETGSIFPLMRKIKPKRPGRRAAQQIGMFCKGNNCSLMISSKGSVKSINALSVRDGQTSIASTRTIIGKAVTSDTWLFRMPRTSVQESGLYIRIIFDTGPSKLLEL